MFRLRNAQFFRISLLAAVSVALALTAGCSRDPNVRKHKYLESGKKYAANGKYKEAGIQFSNALRIDKNYGDAHFELAKLYLKMGSGMPAYHELLRTVDLLPQNLEARVDLGNILMLGRPPALDRATDQANAVLAINPNYADAYALLSGIARQKGDTAEAMKDIERAIALDPQQSGVPRGGGGAGGAGPGEGGDGGVGAAKGSQFWIPRTRPRTRYWRRCWKRRGTYRVRSGSMRQRSQLRRTICGYAPSWRAFTTAKAVRIRRTDPPSGDR